MKFGISGKITAVVVTLFVAVGIVFATVSYQVTSRQMLTAAGIELDGCASITTGLIQTSDLERLMSGNRTLLPRIENEIGWIIEHKPIFKNAYIMTVDGKLLAADNSLKEQGFKAGDTFYIDHKAIEELVSMRHATYSGIYRYGDADRMTGYAPIFKDHDPAQEIIAVNAIDFDASVIRQRTVDSLIYPFTVGLATMIAVFLALYFIIRRMARPMIRITGQVHQIAGGNLSVEPLTIRSKDEIGNLARDVNLMAANLRALFQEVYRTANHVAASSRQLSASAEQSFKSCEQITEIIEEVSRGSDNQLRSVQGSSQAMNTISDHVRQIANHTDAVTSKAKYAFANTMDGNKAVHAVIRQMDATRSTIQVVENAVLSLHKRSGEIDNIVQSITAIAGQTNILALNAGIEAVRAGSHGHGFAVVASEVRKLAEQSASSANQIAELIRDIRMDIDQSSRSVSEVASSMGDGVKKAELAGELFAEISGSVEEVSEQIQEVSSAIQRMILHTEEVADSIDLIVNVAGQTSTGMVSVAAASEEQLATVHEISSSADFLSHTADELQARMNRFKL
ncbi:methyl-accepting chemotaxis protein [Cohnella panacarvi]|uniref:methyl-accepting chemotaxis protein n=1 Tax=Cohnella panacarvi TaxID=400776 RepID=UPI00047E028D|nr:methyl-accepting chemotaxis protein [Cohnella panacarvi]